VRGPDKKCQIVEKRPSEYQAVIVGDKAYVSRNEAPAAAVVWPYVRTRMSVSPIAPPRCRDRP